MINREQDRQSDFWQIKIDKDISGQGKQYDECHNDDVGSHHHFSPVVHCGKVGTSPKATGNPGFHTLGIHFSEFAQPFFPGFFIGIIKPGFKVELYRFDGFEEIKKSHYGSVFDLVLRYFGYNVLAGTNIRKFGNFCLNKQYVGWSICLSANKKTLKIC
jgi:hypothetical protein